MKSFEETRLEIIGLIDTLPFSERKKMIERLCLRKWDIDGNNTIIKSLTGTKETMKDVLVDYCEEWGIDDYEMFRAFLDTCDSDILDEMWDIFPVKEIDLNWFQYGNDYDETPFYYYLSEYPDEMEELGEYITPLYKTYTRAYTRDKKLSGLGL